MENVGDTSINDESHEDNNMLSILDLSDGDENEIEEGHDVVQDDDEKATSTLSNPSPNEFVKIKEWND